MMITKNNMCGLSHEWPFTLPLPALLQAVLIECICNQSQLRV